MILLCLLAASPAPYRNDFEHAEIGKVPDEFLVLGGSFAVAQSEGNKFLELAADPLESDGLLFGPAEGAIDGDVSARIWGQSTGRRFPEFGIGSNDAGGYKLWLLPGQARIELRKGEQPVASEKYPQWKSGTWTHLRLRVEKSSGDRWKIQGKAWPQDATEPQAWTFSVEEAQAPVPGRPSIWGTAYSGKSIRFDDLSFTALP